MRERRYVSSRLVHKFCSSIALVSPYPRRELHHHPAAAAFARSHHYHHLLLRHHHHYFDPWKVKSRPPLSRHLARQKGLSRSSLTYYSVAPGPPTGRLPRFSRRRTARMSDADADDVRNRPQQSPLASQRAKQQAEAEGRKTSRFANMFPMGYKETFSQWWANVPAATAEHNVLSFIPYLQSPPTQSRTGAKAVLENASNTTDEPSTDDLTRSPSQSAEGGTSDPYGPRTWHSNLVPLSGRNRALNEFSVERPGEEVKHNLVILHGYGAGLGFFYKNFEPLSRTPGWRLYALDLLGMGRSTRPAFRIRADPAKQREASISEAEDWFVDSLEEWRRARGIPRMTLLAHSLGGYMAVAYALKYPGRLEKLILASPVGIPEDPYAVSAALPEPESSTVQAEVTQGQGETTAAAKGDNNNFLNARSKAEKDASNQASGQPPRKPLPKWLVYLWDANISPFSLVRWSGPLGPRFVSGWTSRRFSHLPPAEAQALHTYAYTLFKQRGSGEYALAYVLAPGAFARSPLIRRIGGVGRQWVPAAPELGSATEGAAATAGAAAETNGNGQAPPPLLAAGEEGAKPGMVRERGVPTVLVYGENDWMDVAGGYAAVEKLNEEKKKALDGLSEEEKRKDQGDSSVRIIKKAGHHVYLDGWEEFNELIRKEMEDVEERAAAVDRPAAVGGGLFR